MAHSLRDLSVLLPESSPCVQLPGTKCLCVFSLLRPSVRCACFHLVLNSACRRRKRAALGWQVETAGPQYNLFVVLFGISVHDAGALPTPQDFTISFSCSFV